MAYTIINPYLREPLGVRENKLKDSELTPQLGQTFQNHISPKRFQI